MERAGVGLARVTAAAARPGPVRVVCGKGNNGGDGLVVARLLREEGREVDVLAVGDLSETKGDARANLDRLPGDPPRPFAAGRTCSGSGVIVDAMLGTGFEGEPREPVAGAIAAINDAERAGRRLRRAVRRQRVDRRGRRRTPCRRMRPPPSTGRRSACTSTRARSTRAASRSIEIGIPRDAPRPERRGPDLGRRARRCVPPRPRAGTKFKSGVVVVAGGARGLTGAPTMAALAAMRTGAGYVQVAVPASTEPTFDLKLLEAMTHGLPEDDGAHVPEGVDRVLELCERAGALVLGPGHRPHRRSARVGARGRAPRTVSGADRRGRAERARGPAGVAARAPAPTVLTPHEGELGRLLEIDSDEVQAARLECAREAAERSGCVVVLKGDDTIVAMPEGTAADQPGRHAGARDRGHRRRALRARRARCSRRAWSRSRRRRRACSPTRAPARWPPTGSARTT